MLRQLLNGLAKRTQHSSQHVAVYEPQAIASGLSAHALAQQCCVNVAKRVQHHATSKMLHEKFDRFQIWSNMLQHIATCRNRVAKRTQHVVSSNVARCCVEMLRAFGQALSRNVAYNACPNNLFVQLYFFSMPLSVHGFNFVFHSFPLLSPLFTNSLPTIFIVLFFTP